MRRGSQPSAKKEGAAEGNAVVEVVGEGVGENVGVEVGGCVGVRVVGGCVGVRVVGGCVGVRVGRAVVGAWVVGKRVGAAVTGALVTCSSSRCGPACGSAPACRPRSAASARTLIVLESVAILVSSKQRSMLASSWQSAHLHAKPGDFSSKTELVSQRLCAQLCVHKTASKHTLSSQSSSDSHSHRAEYTIT
jgi:hypothetical protein